MAQRKKKKNTSKEKKTSINRIKRVTLTCLCLYSIRQATIWVDMIAEDLFAAVRDRSENKDPIFRLTTINQIFIQMLN